MRKLSALVLLAVMQPWSCSQVEAQVAPPPIQSVSGNQKNVSMASATALTVPAGANMVVITFEGTNDANGFCVNWQDDGTNPTAGDGGGQQLANGDHLIYRVVSTSGLAALPIKMIARTGTSCTFSASYYRWN